MIGGSGVCHGPNCTGPDCVACKVYAWMEQLPTVEDRAPIKLTDWQIDMLHRLYPPAPSKFIFDGQIGRYDAVPIERVDTVEESTPYEQAFGREFQRVWLNHMVSSEPDDGAAKQQVASKDPQVGVLAKFDLAAVREDIMMTAREHFEEAEERLRASDWQWQEGSVKGAMHEAAVAHVHATLALAAAHGAHLPLPAEPPRVRACHPPTMAVMVDGKVLLIPQLPFGGERFERIDLVVYERRHDAPEMPAVLHGVPAMQACPPALASNDLHHQVPLASVRVRFGQQQITQADITAIGR